MGVPEFAAHAVNVTWRWGSLAVGLMLAASAGWMAGRATQANAATPANAEQSAHAGMKSPLSAPPLEPAKASCRQGAFVEAASIINSVVDIALALPSDTKTQTRAVLDTVLTTVIVQARAEVHCVAGKLRFGYQRTYADTVRHGVSLAKVRGLSADVIQKGNETVEILERNQPTRSPAAR